MSLVSLLSEGANTSLVENFKTLLSLGTVALSWMLEDPVMAILFLGGIAGVVFGVIKKGKRAAKG